MACHNCRIEARRFGKHRNGRQRFRCAQCGKTFTEAHEKLSEFSRRSYRVIANCDQHNIIALPKSWLSGYLDDKAMPWP